MVYIKSLPIDCFYERIFIQNSGLTLSQRTHLMPKHFVKIALLILLLFAFVILALYMKENEPMHYYKIKAVSGNKRVVNVVSITPTAKHSHNIDKIANGTLFLLMKDKDELFYITSLAQISPFSEPNKVIDKNTPIYHSLYLGRYNKKKHEIEYQTLNKANVQSLVLYHQDNQNKEKDKSVQPGGAFIMQLAKNKLVKLHVGIWPYSHKLLNNMNLAYDKKHHIEKEVEEGIPLSFHNARF